MKASTLVAAATAAALAAVPLALVAQSLPVVNQPPRDIGRCADADLSQLRGSSDVVSCTCPADEYISGDIWGTDVYTDDSHVCTAAYHAGAMQRGAGGTVTLMAAGAGDGFPASERNGLESRQWGSYGGSFRFVEYRPGSAPVAAMSETPRDIGRCADADLTQMRGQAGALLSCSCPADTYISGDIWGSGTYTDDSHICTAAYHDGALSRGAGGSATFRLSGAQDGFAATERNGLQSRDWGAYDGSFTFEASQ